ncbi:hypothetical protein [Micromonospora parathelypteridis]|uniref:Uncharacterized protein n=1 Tax=Micromonospora parathelypteridis TaxID=1839617 RepID=A0A840W3R3_9ACTN|nr:hypothetical protein [Micromonospora parathelypteridis]MBB5480684.1 hypothetical protein [Micromonospora parathelypteridis]GGO22173.1 hypothetical protein GCM10011576_41200 [Micromonospora parathelypteridis]
MYNYALINVGVETATGVQRIPTGEISDGFVDLDVGDGRVLPGGELEITAAWSLVPVAPSRELFLTWDGQSDPLAVPIPLVGYSY